MLTRIFLTSLTFAVVIGCGAGAFALMSDVRPSKGFGGDSHVSSFWRSGDHDDDHGFDHDDDDDD